MDNKNKITKCLKSYLAGKKYYNSDISKSFEYFKQCITIVNEIKDDKNLDTSMLDIIDETETECSKYITSTIEKTLDTPIDIVTNTTTNQELYEIIETGNIKLLKKFQYNEIDFSELNEYGLTPLHFAVKFGDTNFLKYSFILGGYINQTNKFGHTLLEYACLEKDPNMINFLVLHGAEMKKHILFRKNKTFINNGYDMDIILIQSLIMNYDAKYDKLIHLNWICKFIDVNLDIDILYNESDTPNIKTLDLLIKLDNLIDNLDENYRNTFLDIIKEELQYNLQNKLGCPKKSLDIILYNLVPFINYEYNLRFNWLLSQEIKFLILKILKSTIKINIKILKNELSTLLEEIYIIPNILPPGLINIIILQWIHKIKV